jgi:hypothetical protein
MCIMTFSELHMSFVLLNHATLSYCLKAYISRAEGIVQFIFSEGIPVTLGIKRRISRAVDSGLMSAVSITAFRHRRNTRLTQMTCLMS